MKKGRFTKWMKELSSEYSGTRVIKDLGCFGKSGLRKAIFECKHCKTNFVSNLAAIKSGNTTSCGCFRKKQALKSVLKHGDTSGNKIHPIYKAWQGIKERCYNKNAKNYNTYGGKGITMCDEWLKSYDSFKKWSLENGWERGLQIDKDIKSGPIKTYSPSTCMWIKPHINASAVIHKIGSTGFKNVTFDKRRNTYHGQFSHKMKRYTTKSFKEAAEAFKAVSKLKIELKHEGEVEHGD